MFKSLWGHWFTLLTCLLFYPPCELLLLKLISSSTKITDLRVHVLKITNVSRNSNSRLLFGFGAGGTFDGQQRGFNGRSWCADASLGGNGGAGGASGSAAFALPVAHGQRQGVALPPAVSQRLAADDGVALILLILPSPWEPSPVIGRSGPQQAAVRAVEGAAPAGPVHVLLVRALAGHVASRRLGAGQETEGGGHGAEAVHRDGVAGEVVGADRGQKGGLGWVAAEGEGQRVGLRGGLGGRQRLQGGRTVHAEALGKLCGV